MGKRLRAVIAACAAVGTSLGVMVAAAPPAAAGHHGPSARAVAAAKAAARHREHQVARAARRLSAAEQRMQRLATTAEIAIEAYDEARVKQQAAADAVHSAQLVLDTATQRVDDAQARVAQFASTAYKSGGMTTLDAVLTADGPASLVSRVGTLDVISKAQRDATQELDAARVYQLAVEREAQATLARARAAATVAATARSRAQQAVARQQTLVRSVRERRQHLSVLLARARHHASALERARLAAIARARARAAARAARLAAQQAQASITTTGATGDVTGTVDPGTEQQAVTYAESQIGKPYQWGGAGPDTYDCSGLVMWAYAHVGVHLDHWTGFQWQEGARIAISSLRPGDLVFFATNTSDPNTIHHVGMFIGNGEMVEAPHTGANVRISSMWRPDLIGAVRPYQR